MSAIVGIMGRKRAGKTQFAYALQSAAGKSPSVVLSFADAIREIMHSVDPIIGYENGEFVRYATVVDEDGYEAAKEYPEFRRFAQRLGTEGGRRVFGENVWVDIVMRKIEACNAAAELCGEPLPLILIPDVRFLNEYEAIKGAGGYVVTVERPSLNDVRDEEDLHASEISWMGLKPDTVVINDGGVGDLMLRAHLLLEAVS